VPENAKDKTQKAKLKNIVIADILPQKKKKNTSLIHKLFLAFFRFAHCLNSQQ